MTTDSNGSRVSLSKFTTILVKNNRINNQSVVILLKTLPWSCLRVGGASGTNPDRGSAKGHVQVEDIHCGLEGKGIDGNNQDWLSVQVP